jgi:hypothetical protein
MVLNRWTVTWRKAGARGTTATAAWASTVEFCNAENIFSVTTQSTATREYLRYCQCSVFTVTVCIYVCVYAYVRADTMSYRK